MAVQKLNPNYYATQDAITGTSTGVNVDFGFNATYIRLDNRGDTDVYFELGSTSIASTGEVLLSTGEKWDAQVPPTRSLGLGTGATSTGTRVDVLALGG